MLQKKFLAYSWRNPHWKKGKLNFLFGFWKADLSGTCWAPEEHVSRPSTFVFSVLSSHSFCSGATPGFCRASCLCLLHYPGKCIRNPASLKHCGYPNHCVKKKISWLLEAIVPYEELHQVPDFFRHCLEFLFHFNFCQWLNRKSLKWKVFLMGHFHWRDLSGRR